MLKSVKLSGEREEGNRILHSPCSLLVVGCCVVGLCYRFLLYGCCVGWVSLCFLSTPCIIIIDISSKKFGWL